ncbi:hypothetical protein ABC733_06715 [Mangrovibacter sp. SLW1]
MFIVEALIIINILFEDVNGLELGSVTDWLSAGSSIITLIFAAYVYSNWQKEKYRDDAYEIQKKIVTQYYPKIFNTLEELEFKLENYNSRILSYNHSLKDSVLMDMQTYLLDTITELEVSTQQLTNDLDIMRLFRYEPIDQFQKITLGFTKTIALLIQIIRTIITSLLGLKMSEFDRVRQSMYRSFTGNIPEAKKILLRLTEAKTYIFSNNTDLRKLFVNF